MQEDENQQKVKQGKNYAVYLLSYADRSKNEIRERLRKKQYPRQVIQEVIRYLEEKEFLNDQKFAREFTSSKIRKGFSYKKIEYLLRQKRVDENIITRTLRDIFSQVDEKKMATELLHRKKYLPLKKGLKPEDRIKKLSRIYRFLSSHGFSSSTIKKLLEEREGERP